MSEVATARRWGHHDTDVNQKAHAFIQVEMASVLFCKRLGLAKAEWKWNGKLPTMLDGDGRVSVTCDSQTHDGHQTRDF
jgi:hypothetical protein